jgi:recombination associated protein RdgC
MFKNATIYRIDAAWNADLQAVEQALQASTFTPCGATQDESAGWLPARGQTHGALVESIGGEWIARYHSEHKMLPAAVIEKRVQEKCDAIERECGRTPGRKERYDLKEEARLDLLPQAFVKEASTMVWISKHQRLLAIDTATQARADAIASLLVECLPGFAPRLLNTTINPQAAMAQWLLTQEAPPSFSIDQECELKASDDSKAVVRYGNHPLDIEEVRQHIQAGKLPTKLAMTWDGRVSFVLDAALRLRKIELLDVEIDSNDGGGFDADVTLCTDALSKLLPDLIQALGGEA